MWRPVKKEPGEESELPPLERWGLLAEQAEGSKPSDPGSASEGGPAAAIPAPHCGRRSAVKTPRFNGKVDWDAFLAQFHLVARLERWTEEEKALQLAGCLAEDVLPCLLTLAPEQQADLGGGTSGSEVLRSQFGSSQQPGLLSNELQGRTLKPGETLRELAATIEVLTRRAFAHMPPAVQEELARNQFVEAIGTGELRAWSGPWSGGNPRGGVHHESGLRS
ncbi:hypothetical protein EOD39_11933 [Acipenser ruthenus]|uniref:Uncharacterized protein n=1 Tax=Acipenser ruthenus TaxID=7906 RepID=A0A662YSZ6_ACIRT|nr:hypothetical protein EOD39_11933 [Acipenser ruthenus]